MQVIDGDWTPKGIILTMACDCGEVFRHPTWRRWATCPKCGYKGDLIKLKSEDSEKAWTPGKEKNENMET